MDRPAALVFDLDGTLIDSRRDITTAINRMREELGLPPLPLEAVVTMVGNARVVADVGQPNNDGKKPAISAANSGSASWSGVKAV